MHLWQNGYAQGLQSLVITVRIRTGARILLTKDKIMKKLDREDVALIKDHLVELKVELTGYKKLKKNTYIRYKIRKLKERIERNNRWIKELNALNKN